MEKIRKINKKTKIWITAMMTMFLCVGVGTAAYMHFTGSNPMANFVVYGAGTPDSYGNRIVGVFFTNNNTLARLCTITSSNYTSGMTVTLPVVSMCISVECRLNNTLNPGGTGASAFNVTRVYLTISIVTTNTLMNNMIALSGTPSGFWDLVFGWPCSAAHPYLGWTPTVGTTYNLNVTYQAYY